jgi:hypothetical protein
VTEHECNFVLSKIAEDEIKDKPIIEVFEPTVTLELRGHNVFQALGVEGAEPVVIMVFLEEALEATERIVAEIERREPRKEHEYWLHGTGYAIIVLEEGGLVHISLEADWGPGAEKGRQAVGTVPTAEWIRAVVMLSKELLDRYRRLNPQVYAGLGDMVQATRRLELWPTAPRDLP